MRVICLGGTGWINIGKGVECDLECPEKDKLYTVTSVHKYKGNTFYELEGFEDFYFSGNFREVDVAWVDSLLHHLERQEVYSRLGG